MSGVHAGSARQEDGGIPERGEEANVGANALLLSVGDLEVVLEFGLGLSVAVVDVAYDDSMLEQGDAGADVDGVLQVVARDEYGGAGLLVVLREEVLDGALAAGVEEVEGLVEDEHLWAQEHGCDDTYLLLVAGAQVADEFLLSDYLVCHEVAEAVEEGLQVVGGDSADACYELEVFVGGEVVDEEGFVDVCTCPVFPLLGFSHVHVDVGLLEVACHVHVTVVGFYQVEDESEEGALASSVVAHKSQHLTAVDGVAVDVDGDFLAKTFLQVIDLYLHDFLCVKKKDVLCQ